MTDDKWKPWLNSELWSLWEAAYLLCGRLPAPTELDFARSDRDAGGEVGHAYRALKNGTRAGSLAFVKADAQDTFMRRLVVPRKAIEWAVGRGWAIPPQLKALEPDSSPPATPTPAGTKAALPHWKMRAQAYAAKRWKELRASGCTPTRASIHDDVAKWCRANNVFTDSGITPSANYLRTHVLSAKHWTPPT